MAPSSLRDAADTSTSWVPVSFIGTSVRFATALPPLPKPAEGWKADGPFSSDAPFAGEVQSFLVRLSLENICLLVIFWES